MLFSTGLTLAALSAVANGSWGLFAKLIPGGRSPNPLIFNHWAAEGVAVSGLMLLAIPPRVFSPWGVLSGLLFILSAGNAVLAIQQVGLAVASGVWCGVAVLTSFAWATLVGGDHIDRPGQAAAALVLLLAGITGIAGAGAWGSPAQCKDDSHREEDPLLDDEAEGGGPHRCSPRATGTLLGFGAAVAAGALGGLILAPMLAAPAEVRGLQYVPSMAVGTLLGAPAISVLLACFRGSGVTLQTLGDEQVMRAGAAAGVVWNCGNVCSILATQDPSVGLAVAYPIMQLGLFVAGAWGIALFGEVQGRGPLTAYWLSGLVLVAGAALLAAAK